MFLLSAARRLLPAVALVVAAVPGSALLAPPAYAATCAPGAGVSVVVDFHGLGPGGVETACLSSGGGDKAAALFAAAGHELTRAQRQPGFVCRVDAVPAEDPCVNTSPADAYWGLWWSDGESGSWTYSSLGVDSLSIPDGGSVAFAWDDQSGQVQPGATPPQQSTAPPPSSSTSPSGPAGGAGSPGGSSGSSSSGGAPTPPTSDGSSAPEVSSSADPRGSAGGDGSGTRGGTKAGTKNGQDSQAGRGGRSNSAEQPAPAEDPTEQSDESDGATDPGVPEEVDGSETAPAAAVDGGLPVWVAPLALLVLAGAGGGVALVRRRNAA